MPSSTSRASLAEVAAVDRRVGEASRAPGTPPVPAVDGEGRRMPVLLPRTGPVAGGCGPRASGIERANAASVVDRAACTSVF